MNAIRHHAENHSARLSMMPAAQIAALEQVIAARKPFAARFAEDSADDRADVDPADGWSDADLDRLGDDRADREWDGRWSA